MRAPWRRRSRARDREAEVRAHLELLTADLIDRGVAPEEAARRARLAFGNPRLKLEEVSDMDTLPVVEPLWRDTRHAIRVFRRTPAFTLTTVATLALVIGACTAVFSLADALLIRQLPYPDADRLTMLVHRASSGDGEFVQHWVDGAMWEAVRDHVPALDTAVVGTGGGANLVVNGAATYVEQERVSEGFSRVLGIGPARGRWFNAAEDRADGPAAVVLSYGLWQRAFGGAEDIVGRSILLRGEPYGVVGVMPATFVSLTDADIWTPLRPSSTGEGGGTNYQVIARLTAGSTWPEAEGQLRAAGSDGFRLLGIPDGITRELGIESLHAALAGDVREPIVLLGWAVGVVLLIACVNLAALMLARGAARSREIATRLALGGGRAAVVRQLMIEALVLAVAGGAAGVLVASVGLDGLKTLGGDRFQEWTRAAIDARVLTIALGLSVVTSIVFGLAPALQASRLDVSRALTESGSRSVVGRSTIWRRSLVVAEIALGVVLLVASGLLIRTFINVRSLDPGFDPSGLVTASVSLQDARYQDAASVNRLFDDSLRRLRAEPDIEAAAVSLQLPYDRLLNSGFRFVDDASVQGKTTNVSYVTDGFLETLRWPLRRGRNLGETDRADGPPVAIVNETFERVYSPERAVLGRRIRVGGVEREIVGVTGDVQQRPSFTIDSIAPGPLVSLPLVLIPAAQTTDGYFRTAHTWFAPVWTVRSRDTTGAAMAIRAAIEATDSQLPVFELRTMDDVMSEATAAQRLLMTLVGVLAAAAVLLAAIGVAGVIAQSVAERRREFGIRMALGATAAGAVRSVSSAGLLLAALGATLGAVLSIPAASLVQAFLWRVEAGDPSTYITVAIVLFVIAAIASVLPALKLLRVNPAETLRN